MQKFFNYKVPLFEIFPQRWYAVGEVVADRVPPNPRETSPRYVSDEIESIIRAESSSGRVNTLAKGETSRRRGRSKKRNGAGKEN